MLLLVTNTLIPAGYVAEYDSAKSALESQSEELATLRAEVDSLTAERAALQTKLAVHVDSVVSTELAAAQSEVSACNDTNQSGVG